MFVHEVKTRGGTFNAKIISRFNTIRFGHRVGQGCAAGDPGFIATDLHAVIAVLSFYPGKWIILSVFGDGECRDTIRRESMLQATDIRRQTPAIRSASKLIPSQLEPAASPGQIIAATTVPHRHVRPEHLSGYGPPMR